MVSIPEFAEDVPLHEHSVAHDISGVGERGPDFSIIGFHEDIRDTLTVADNAGLDVGLERLAEYREPSSLLVVLTTQQQEVMETAFAMGYYDVPRDATTEEIATEGELDPSTVAERSQRAEHDRFPVSSTNRVGLSEHIVRTLVSGGALLGVALLVLHSGADLSMPIPAPTGTSGSTAGGCSGLDRFDYVVAFGAFDKHTVGTIISLKFNQEICCRQRASAFRAFPEGRMILIHGGGVLERVTPVSKTPVNQ